MTYRELAKRINDMPNIYQDCNVSVLEHQEEIFGVVGMCNAIEVCMDDVIEKNHPLLILNGVFTEEELKDINFS